MNKLLKQRSLLTSIIGAFVVAAGCNAVQEADSADEVTADFAPVEKLCAIGRACGNPLDGTKPYMVYHGGRTISHVRVHEVQYGSGTYLPEITAVTGQNMAASYKQIFLTGILDWLNEYNFNGQSIGRGGFAGTTHITPSSTRNGPIITDAQIQQELRAQIQSGVLQPSDDDLYMVHFPSGKSLVHADNSTSCTSEGFCGYHHSFVYGESQIVNYAVLPSLLDGLCATACGVGTPFARQQQVAAHEIIEAISDPEHASWYQLSGYEMADVCASNNNGPRQWSFLGTDGRFYSSVYNWSNRDMDGACITTRSQAVTGSAGILWRKTDGSTAIWHDANASATTLPGTKDPALWTIVGVGDFNGDHIADILWRDTAGNNVIWPSGVGASEYKIAGVEPAWRVVGIGDFDGDGKSDILWRDVNGNNSIWPGGVPGYWIDQLSTYWHVAAVADFNRDGKSDILWTNALGQVAVWPNGSSQGYSPGTLAGGWEIAGVGDFDHNGYSDILWRCNTSAPCGLAAAGSVAIWDFVNGNYGFTSYPGGLDGNWQLQGVGDFNHDGVSDILWRCLPIAPATTCGDAMSGSTAIWQFANNVVGQVNWPGALDSTWQIQGVGKFD